MSVRRKANRFRSLRLISTDKDNRLTISEEGIEEINSKLTYRAQTTENGEKLSETESENGNKPTSETTENPENLGAETEQVSTNKVFSDIIATLQKQLEEKDKQLAEKDKQLAAKDEQITNLTAAVDKANASINAAQALAAADKQLLLEANTKTHWWQFGKKKKQNQNNNFTAEQ